jgi:transglutaminase-like putative cysteine protease
MNKSLIYGLLLSILMVIAPHADHLPIWISSMCIGLLSWRAYLAHNGKPLPKRWLLILLTLAGTIGIVFEFHTLFGREAGVTLLVMLATLKPMELHKSRDAMVLIYLACFIIITNFVYSQSIPTALYLLATMIVIVTTWVHLQAQNIALMPRLRIAAVLLLQAIPLTLILFILFPRVPGPLWGLPQDAYAGSGLDDKMSPGSLSRLSLSEAVAFRVIYSGNPPRRDQMYWRGPVLWNFDGRTWTPGITTLTTAPQFTELDQAIDYSVTLEPHNKIWLFALDVPDKLTMLDKLSVPATSRDTLLAQPADCGSGCEAAIPAPDASQRRVMAATLTYDFRILNKEPVNARLRYAARSHLVYRANLQEAARQLQRGLQLPKEFNPRARQLAAEWRAQAEAAPPPQLSPGGRGGNRSLAEIDETLVRTALTYFNKQGFIYTLEPPPLDVNTVDDFLFNTKQGFCEHYASAFVFLMRAANVPARVVTGYQGGEFNDVGNYYIVRQSDAHAWAEVWLAGQGWVRIDPTGAIAPDRVQRGLSAAISDNAALPFMARNPPQWMRDLRFNLDTLANQWNQWVLGYDAERQFAFLTRLGMESVTWQKMALNMMSGLGVVIALFALFMLRHLFARQPDKVQAAWLKLCGKLAKSDLPRAAHEGAQDYAARVAAARPELAGAIHDLATRYSALRYGSLNDEQAQREFLQRATALNI